MFAGEEKRKDRAGGPRGGGEAAAAGGLRGRDRPGRRARAEAARAAGTSRRAGGGVRAAVAAAEREAAEERAEGQAGEGAPGGPRGAAGRGAGVPGAARPGSGSVGPVGGSAGADGAAAAGRPVPVHQRAALHLHQPRGRAALPERPRRLRGLPPGVRPASGALAREPREPHRPLPAAPAGLAGGGGFRVRRLHPREQRQEQSSLLRPGAAQPPGHRLRHGQGAAGGRVGGRGRVLPVADGHQPAGDPGRGQPRAEARGHADGGRGGQPLRGHPRLRERHGPAGLQKRLQGPLQRLLPPPGVRQDRSAPPPPRARPAPAALPLQAPLKAPPRAGAAANKRLAPGGRGGAAPGGPAPRRRSCQ